jgi:hypothetical protein
MSAGPQAAGRYVNRYVDKALDIRKDTPHAEMVSTADARCPLPGKGELLWIGSRGRSRS